MDKVHVALAHGRLKEAQDESKNKRGWTSAKKKAAKQDQKKEKVTRRTYGTCGACGACEACVSHAACAAHAAHAAHAVWAALAAYVRRDLRHPHHSMAAAHACR